MVALEKLNINLKKSWRLDKSPGVMITSPYRGIKHFPLPIRSCRFRFYVVTGMTFNQFKYFISLDLYVVPHCVKTVRVRSFSSSYFPAFGLNTERHYLSVFSPNAGKYGPEKLRTRTLFTHCLLKG